MEEISVEDEKKLNFGNDQTTDGERSSTQSDFARDGSQSEREHENPSTSSVMDTQGKDDSGFNPKSHGRTSHSSGPRKNRTHYGRNRGSKGSQAGMQGEAQALSEARMRELRLLDASKRGALELLSLADLNVIARKIGLVGAALMRKEELVEKIKFLEANPEVEVEVTGVFERLTDGFGFLRSAAYDYVAGPDDIYVSHAQVRRFNLRTGDTIVGTIRKPREGEKYFALSRIVSINFQDPSQMLDRPDFDRLSPWHPQRKFNLEYSPTSISTRIMDLFTPIGKGQRGLIVAQPKVGKTVLLKELAQALIANHPEVVIIVLCIDERPEEVADMRRMIRGSTAEVISSTFDEPAERHVQVAEIVIEKAKRLVECKRDVVIFLDSITRLARAYNTIAPASGKVLTGGIDANALQRPKRFFGAARNTDEGGSLTIIASALIDTGSRMDEVIYEEFKGTGNMEMHMTRKLANRRTYPAFDLGPSGTRRDDLLHSEEDLNKVFVLQKFLSTMNVIEGMEFLIEKMKKYKTNVEFLECINKKNGEHRVAHTA